MKSDEEQKHPWQKVLDNPWLLLFLGVAVPFVSYTIWGWIELFLMSEAKLP